MSSLKEFTQGTRLHGVYRLLSRRLPWIVNNVERAYSALDYGNVVLRRRNVDLCKRRLESLRGVQLQTARESEQKWSQEYLRILQEKEAFHLPPAPSHPVPQVREAEEVVFATKKAELNSLIGSLDHAETQMQRAKQQLENVFAEIEKSVTEYSNAVTECYQSDENFRNLSALIGFSVSLSGMCVGSGWAWYRTSTIRRAVEKSVLSETARLDGVLDQIRCTVQSLENTQQRMAGALLAHNALPEQMPLKPPAASSIRESSSSPSMNSLFSHDGFIVKNLMNFFYKEPAQYSAASDSSRGEDVGEKGVKGEGTEEEGIEEGVGGEEGPSLSIVVGAVATVLATASLAAVYFNRR